MCGIWLLTSVLLFSCDADPAALAKYVVALLRKDKPKSDLKELCVDQLEVFLAKGKHQLCITVVTIRLMSAYEDDLLVKNFASLHFS